jgi:glycyl-tRNA synthetase
MARQTPSLETLVAFAKRRGFVYESSEIYGGFSGVYDFGPYGVLLANNIKQAWWKAMVQMEDNIVGLDAGIAMQPKVWEASGHVGGFSDPLVECKACNTRSRADHLLESVNLFADEKMSLQEINALFDGARDKIVCPNCGKKQFTEVKTVNLLVKSNLGNFTDDYSKDPVYLRGETCQGIYVNFKNVMDTTRVKIPFGIAQIGKAFRNEIAPRQWIFRKREFEQMEMQLFTKPEEAAALYEVWKAKRMQYYLDLGFNKDNLQFHEHENLVFYAKAAFDIEYRFPFGFKELEGIHNRGNYDLTQHATFSGQKLVAKADEGPEYVPHVVETSVGLDRTYLAVLTEFYDEDEIGGEKRVVLRLPHALAPIKVAVFPLLKNKPELVAKAREVFNAVRGVVQAEFDDNGNVGKRYRRQDEIGTPYCVTIDFDTLGENKELENTMTLRDRDTGEQRRVSLPELITILKEMK